MSWGKLSMTKKYEIITIENEFFCDDCELRHRITEKALIDFFNDRRNNDVKHP